MLILKFQIFVLGKDPLLPEGNVHVGLCVEVGLGSGCGIGEGLSGEM